MANSIIVWGWTVDGQGNVYIADACNHRIQKFSGNGEFMFARWEATVQVTGNSRIPMATLQSTQGYIYVADSGNHRVQKLSKGRFYLQMGQPRSRHCEFNYPHGIAVDAVDNVFVGDYKNHRVEKFASDGTYLTQWGSAELATGNSATQKASP